MKALLVMKAAIAAFLLLPMVAIAEPITYIADPAHTYPAFEADHQGGLSLWRGKINSSSGTVVLDKEAKTGTVEIEMDINSIDFGLQAMNESALDHIFNVKDHPTATYTGTLVDFNDGSPTRVDGQLSLNGVTKDVDLTINRFLCKPHFRLEREVCGADAEATINRGEFDVIHGLDGAFLPEVKLLISIEAMVPEA